MLQERLFPRDPVVVLTGLAWMGLVWAGLAWVGSPAAAQSAPTQPPPSAQRGAAAACRADYDALCASVAPGGGRIVACLRQHAAQLSPACREALAAARPAAR